MSASLMTRIALLEISSKLPMGVATINRPIIFFSITILFTFLISCTPVNFTKQYEQNKKANEEKKPIQNIEEKLIIKNNNNELNENNDLKLKNIALNKNITILLPSQKNESFTKQFLNILEIAVYNKKLENVNFNVEFFTNDSELEKIILNTKKDGKIYIGPIESTKTNVVKKYCEDNVIFFSFSSDTNLAQNCIYLFNFFPKNELEQLFISLEKDSKLALLYPENEYGYLINSLIDDALNKSEVILVNRASYRNDLTNVRDAIKELGKYELRKYELERQKKILSLKEDEQSKKRLKKLGKFKTTSDYEFTHIILADYGLNLLQVAPLLPYYDIDPNVVQFLGTGVLDDENFFSEPSLQGALFPGVQKNKRSDLLNQYQLIYNEKLLRVSTLPYDLVGLLNFVFSNEMNFNELIETLNNSLIRFDGVDGKFNFKNNIVERNLDVLRIENGKATKIN